MILNSTRLDTESSMSKFSTYEYKLEFPSLSKNK